ncbi:unnamed protein product [Rotaria sp. Silwood1]|nr:unnamed protein product [Rotaria sp. Silwood1]
MTNSNSTTVEQNQIHHNLNSLGDVAPKAIPSAENNKEPRPIVEYPHCIDMWTKDHVKSFLLDKELNILLPAFEGMNGRLLHKVYDMCQTSQQAMFSSLKEDVSRSQIITTLSLKDYLTFLEEIKVYVPYTTNDRLNPTSAICNLM